MYSQRAGLLQAVLNESYQLYRFGHNLVSVSLEHLEFDIFVNGDLKKMLRNSCSLSQEESKYKGM